MQKKIDSLAEGQMRSTSSSKKIEIDSIPEDWQVVRIEDIFDFQQGKAVSPKNRLGVSPRYFLRTSNVLWGRVDITTLDSMDFTDEEMAKLNLQPDDLLVCEGGETGRTALWRGEVDACSYQNHIHRLRKKAQDISPEFYMYWMQAAFLIFHMYSGQEIRTTIPNLSQGRLKSFPVPKPPFQEQRKIAKVLRTIQKAIEQQDKIIEAAKNLKKSLMQKLFREGIGHTEYKETEIGPIPASWAVEKLGDCFKLSSGKSRPQVVKENALGDFEFPVFGGNGMIGFSNTYLVDESTLVIGRVGEYCGSIYVCPGKSWITDNALYAKQFLKVDLNLRYLAYRLVMLNLNRLKKKTGQPLITQGILYEQKIPIPPLSEQEQISHVISSADSKINVEKRRKNALSNLFTTMLHDLMTGEIRLKDVEV